MIEHLHLRHPIAKPKVMAIYMAKVSVLAFISNVSPLLSSVNSGLGGKAWNTG
jgi:hypothetical protein